MRLVCSHGCSIRSCSLSCISPECLSSTVCHLSWGFSHCLLPPLLAAHPAVPPSCSHSHYSSPDSPAHSLMTSHSLWNSRQQSPLFCFSKRKRSSFSVALLMLALLLQKGGGEEPWTSERIQLHFENKTGFQSGKQSKCGVVILNCGSTHCFGLSLIMFASCLRNSLAVTQPCRALGSNGSLLCESWKVTEGRWMVDRLIGWRRF